MKNNKRSLFILKYLLEQSDENHLVAIANINEYLRQHDLDANGNVLKDWQYLDQYTPYPICSANTANLATVQGKIPAAHTPILFVDGRTLPITSVAP